MPGGPSAPNALVVDRANGLLWVAGRNSNDVRGLRLDGLQAGAAVGVGPLPFGAAIANGVLYVANYGNGTVSRIVTGSNSRLQPDILVGNEPSWVAADPLTGRVWVALHREAGVAVIVHGSVWRYVDTGLGAFSVAIDATRRMVYVGNRDAKTVTVIDADTANGIRTLSPGGSVFGMAVNQASGDLYVLHGPEWGDCPANRLAIYDWRGFLQRDLPVGDTCPGGWIAVNPNNGRVYLAVTALNQVWVLEADGRTRRVLTGADGVGRAPLGLAVDPVTSRVYVGNSLDNTITVFADP